MQTRLDYSKAAPGSVQAMYKLQKYVDDSGLDHTLLELIKTRVSQINGCAFCIDMHTKDARAAGETEQRLYGLSAWREAPYYSDRERAALAWAEAVTRIGEHVPDSIYEQARAVLTEKELCDLTLAAAAINAWNRISIAGRLVPGAYQPAKSQQAGVAP